MKSCSGLFLITAILFSMQVLFTLQYFSSENAEVFFGEKRRTDMETISESLLSIPHNISWFIRGGMEGENTARWQGVDQIEEFLRRNGLDGIRTDTRTRTVRWYCRWHCGRSPFSCYIYYGDKSRIPKAEDPSDNSGLIGAERWRFKKGVKICD